MYMDLWKGMKSSGGGDMYFFLLQRCKTSMIATALQLKSRSIFANFQRIAGGNVNLRFKLPHNDVV
jgi:hypothetical protein